MLVYLMQALANHELIAKRDGRALARVNIEAAVVDGALMRVRPIMMTVAAIIAGLLPIMLGSGTGSEVMRRIAAPMVGGKNYFSISLTLIDICIEKPINERTIRHILTATGADCIAQRALSEQNGLRWQSAFCSLR